MKLFQGAYYLAAGLGGPTPPRTFDISPDGRRFVMIKQSVQDQAAGAPRLIVVQNWTEELKRLVPVE